MLKLLLASLFIYLMCWVFGSGELSTGQRAQVYMEMRKAKSFLIVLSERGEDPPEDLQSFVRDWRTVASGRKIKHPRECRWLSSGKDPWGKKIVYHFDPQSRILTLRSLGPDKKDDHGQVDDIQQQFDMKRGALPPKAVRSQ